MEKKKMLIELKQQSLYKQLGIRKSLVSPISPFGGPVILFSTFTTDVII